MARNPQKMNVAQKLETVNRCMGHTKRGLEDGRYTRGLIKMRCFTAEKLLDEWQESFTEEMEDRVAETRRKIKKYLKTVEQGYSPKVEYPQGMNVRDDIEKEDVEADIKNIYIGAAGSVFEKNSSRSSSCSSERNTSSGKRKREMHGSINDEDSIEMAAEQAKDGKKKPIRPDTQSRAERQSVSVFDKMVEDSDNDEVDTTPRGDDTLPYDMNREGWWMGEKENVLAELGEMIEMERRVRKDETARFEARQNEKENRLKEELEERDHQLSVLVKATISSRVESMEAETRKENNKLHEKLEMVQEKMERLEAQMAKMTSEQRMGTPAKTERRESIIPNTTILFEGEPKMFEGFIVRHESILARYGEVEEWEKFELLYTQLSNDVKKDIRRFRYSPKEGYKSVMKFLRLRYGEVKSKCTDAFTRLERLGRIKDGNIYQLEELSQILTEVYGDYEDRNDLDNGQLEAMLVVISKFNMSAQLRAEWNSEQTRAKMSLSMADMISFMEAQHQGLARAIGQQKRVTTESRNEHDDGKKREQGCYSCEKRIS
ncbi:unnamed protein product [Dimorphilus gyrociliatus]|uniref:Uncharacterized protein n=1 Tax=Dimorphilus gyrociliatus TaxID=2664684 RepID=A0A7I8WDG5_9ANNE|nr:unnamed protein product [Dimorphilus gyrociliatus]